MVRQTVRDREAVHGDVSVEKREVISAAVALTLRSCSGRCGLWRRLRIGCNGVTGSCTKPRDELLLVAAGGDTGTATEGGEVIASEVLSESAARRRLWPLRLSSRWRRTHVVAVQRCDESVARLRDAQAVSRREHFELVQRQVRQCGPPTIARRAIERGSDKVGCSDRLQWSVRSRRCRRNRSALTASARQILKQSTQRVNCDGQEADEANIRAGVRVRSKNRRGK